MQKGGSIEPPFMFVAARTGYGSGVARRAAPTLDEGQNNGEGRAFAVRRRAILPAQFLQAPKRWPSQWYVPSRSARSIF